MKKIVVILIAFATVGLLNNCAPKVAKQAQTNESKSTPTNEGDVLTSPAISSSGSVREEPPTPIWEKEQDVQMQTFATLSKDALVSGKQLYERKCGNCHKLHATQSRTSESWHSVLKRMRKKAALNEAEYTYIAAYIHANAKQ